jgi:hypothetical protein
MPMAFAETFAGPCRPGALVRTPEGELQAGGHSAIGEDRRFLSRESPSVKRMSCFFPREIGRRINHLVRMTEAAAEIASVGQIL